MVGEEFWRRLDSLGVRSRALGIPSIDPEDGLVLYTLALQKAAWKGRLEGADLGAGIGYSTLWIAAGAEDACSQRLGPCVVTAVEANSRLAGIGEESTAGAGLRSVRVRWVAGDALAFLKSLPDRSLDLVFVDIDKYEYTAALSLLERKLRPGGVAAFHNAYFPRPPDEFFHAVKEGPWVWGIAPTPAGLLVAVLQGLPGQTLG
jgi:predicted O-methyltransferase YrrM